MKRKNIFRMTSVLLISIICVCIFSLNAFASDGGEYYDTEPSEETNTPTVSVIPDETENNEQIAKPENAFTPDGKWKQRLPLMKQTHPQTTPNSPTKTP